MKKPKQPILIVRKITPSLIIKDMDEAIILSEFILKKDPYRI